RQQDVERLGGRGREQHVALLDAAELRRSAVQRRRAYVDAGTGGETAQHVVRVLGVGAAEQRVECDAGGAHDAADARRQARRVGGGARRGGGAGGGAQGRGGAWCGRWGAGSSARAASSSLDGPPVPVTNAHI